jgi:DNA-directed RNA polymerase subunit K/omega
MNADLLKKANEKVGNVHMLVNLVSRRVRQLSGYDGNLSRPLVANVHHLGLADIALREIVEEKMGWEVPELLPVVRLVPKKRRRH